MESPVGWTVALRRVKIVVIGAAMSGEHMLFGVEAGVEIHGGSHPQDTV